MRRRAEAAAGTRKRILEAAHSLLNRSDGTALTLQEVAAAAGVTRATIYKSVGSRAELLAAVFEDQGRLIGYERVRAASALPDAAEALVETVRESSRAWSRMPEAIRKTLALGVIDAEVGEVVARYEGYRRAEMQELARRAYEAGVLGEGVTAKHAAAVLSLLTSFSAFDVLRREGGVRAATEHLASCAHSALGIKSWR
jgi:AcrR family transcriptional regulator